MADALVGNRTVSEFVRLGLKRTHMQVVPIHTADNAVIGEIVVIHEATYIRTEILRIWSRVFVHIVIQVLVIVAITSSDCAVEPCRPHRTCGALDEGPAHRKTRYATDRTRPESVVAIGEREWPAGRKHAAGACAAETEARLRNINESLWTAQRLADHVRNKLDGSNLFVVSNREPYTHTRQDKNISVTVPASGLVTAH